MKPIFAMVLILALAGCKKYEEGPAFSLLSKKARLTGEWELAERFINGVEVNLPTNIESTCTFEKNGEYVEYNKQTSTQIASGNWTFAQDKEILNIQYTATSIMEYTILRLSNRNLWITRTDGGSEFEYHYVKI